MSIDVASLFSEQTWWFVARVGGLAALVCDKLGPARRQYHRAADARHSTAPDIRGDGDPAKVANGRETLQSE